MNERLQHAADFKENIFPRDINFFARLAGRSALPKKGSAALPRRQRSPK
jgi:hypothetical protein